MFHLFLGDPFSVLTTVSVLAMLTFIAVSVIKRQRIRKWGRLILVFVLFGTAISGLSAMRDAYMTENALFSASSAQSTLCSLAGGLIFLTGLVTIFVKNQRFRAISFYLVSALFLLQVVAIEASRIALSLGGTV